MTFCTDRSLIKDRFSDFRCIRTLSDIEPAFSPFFSLHLILHCLSTCGFLYVFICLVCVVCLSLCCSVLPLALYFVIGFISLLYLFDSFPHFLLQLLICSFLTSYFCSNCGRRMYPFFCWWFLKIMFFLIHWFSISCGPLLWLSLSFSESHS